MRSVKLAGLIAVSHFSKLVVALLLIKLIAIALGPAGLGFLGNYMSLISIATALAGGGIITGVVKHLSDFTPGSERQKAFIGNALIYSVVFSLVVTVAGWIFIDSISLEIFGGAEYSAYIIIFLFAQSLAAINNFAYGVLNGLQENSKYALVVVLGNIVSLGAAYFSIHYYGLTGAVLALTFPLVAPLLPIFFFFNRKRNWLGISTNYLLDDFKKLSRFSLMLVASAICFPVVEIYVRNSISTSLGGDAVGIWQALIRLSSAYLSFFSVFLSFYLVPKISKEENGRKLLKAVFNTMFFLSLIFALMFLFVVLIKEKLIVLVFSEAFLEVGDYLLFQMLGDYLRIMGWVIGFVVVAKAATKLYIISELFQGLLFMLFAHMLLEQLRGMEGVVYAYIITCFLYFVISIFGFFFFIHKRRFKVGDV